MGLEGRSVKGMCPLHPLEVANLSSSIIKPSLEVNFLCSCGWWPHPLQDLLPRKFNLQA